MSSLDPKAASSVERRQFLSAVLSNPVIATILERMPQLGLRDWYVTAGSVFQTVWNVISGRDAQLGIHDYDVFYFDGSDLSYAAEDEVIRRVRAVLRHPSEH